MGTFCLSVSFLFEQHYYLPSSYTGKNPVLLRIAIASLHVCFLFWLIDYLKKILAPFHFCMCFDFWLMCLPWILNCNSDLAPLLEVCQLYSYEQHHFRGISFELFGLPSHFHSCKPLWWELYMLSEIFWARVIEEGKRRTRTDRTDENTREYFNYSVDHSYF